MSKSIIYILHFSFYTLLILIIGKNGFKNTRNAKDFFVANNSFGLIYSLFSYSATWFSSASMQGVPGNVYTYGISTIFYSIIPWFSGAILHIILTKKLKEYDILTVPEFFYIRYNSRFLQRLGGILVLITYTFYIIIPITGFGIVISELLEINYLFSIFLIYMFIMYATFGGMFSVGKTHILNYSLIIIGVILAVIVVIDVNGGISNILIKSKDIDTVPYSNLTLNTVKGGLLHPTSKGRVPFSAIFMSFFGWGLGLSANPQYSVHILSANNKITARKMITYALIIFTFVYSGLIILGLGFRVLVPSLNGITSIDQIFPYIINNQIYSKFSGIIFIAICAASISTANSQLLIASSGLTYDIYKTTTKTEVSDKKLLKLTRFSIFFIATVALYLSIDPPESLLLYGSYLWGIFASTFLVPLFGGLFINRANKSSAIGSMVFGLIAFVIFIPVSENIHPALPGVFASLVTFLLFNLGKGQNNEVTY